MKRGSKLKSLKTFDYIFFVNKAREYLKINPIDKLTSFFYRLTTKGFLSKTLKYSRTAVKKFTGLKNINDEAKSSGLASVRHYEIQIASTQYWEDIVTRIIFVPYLILSFFAVFIAPAGVYLGNISFFVVLPKPDTDFSLDSIFLFSVIGLVLTTFLFFGFDKIIPKTFRIAVPVFVVLAYISAITVLYRLANLSDIVILSVISALLGQVVFLIILILTFALLILNKIVFIRLRKTYFPDAVIVHGLVNILFEIDTSSLHWTDVFVRKKIIMEIEEVALCIQFDLYKRLKSGDSIADKWFERITHEIAAALRAKKYWLLTPKADTRLFFSENITNTLISIANGNWDMVEKIEPEKISTQQKWKERLGNTAKVLIVGGAPMGLLWLIQNSPLALSEPVSDYAIGSAILWILFTAITTFDPLFGTKIDALKETINLLLLVGKKP